MSASTTAITIARRSIRASSSGRALLGTPAVRRMIAALRATRVLAPTGRFLVCEVRGEDRVGRYSIGAAALQVHLRHGSRDVEICNEIFSPGRQSYEPPPEVAVQLDSLGPLRIGDVGANIGLFGVYALGRWPTRTLRSYEPDPANAALLRRTITANGRAGVWELAQVAVSNALGTATFEPGLLSESRFAGSALRAARDGIARRAWFDDPAYPRAPTIEVPVVDLFDQPPVDLLKIDIEGAEWPILHDARLASHPARAIVLEWHRRMCPAPEPRAAARAALAAGGYTVIDDDRSETPANGLMWGLRR